MKDSCQKTNDNFSKAFTHNLGNGKGISMPSPVQPQLTIGAVNDSLEQEADAIADKIIQIHEPSSRQQNFFNPGTSNTNMLGLQTGKEKLQRQEDDEEKDIEETIPDIQSKFAFDALPFPPPDDNNINNSSAFIYRKCEACEQEEKEQHIHRKESDSLTYRADSGLESYVSNLSSSGSPLSQERRSFFEPGFGYDFSDVRVHTDSIASKSAESINALDYASGNNIVFHENQFSPETDRGKKLVAYGLTDMVQQKRSQQPKLIQRQNEGSDNDGGNSDAGVPSDAGSSQQGQNFEWLEQQLQCVIYQMGGCPGVPGVHGVADDAAVANYDRQCRSTTHYQGPVLTVADLNCSQPALSIARNLFVSYPNWLSVLPNCPCSVNAVQSNTAWERDANPFLSRYHPGAHSSYRSAQTYESIPGTRHRQQCCYDSNGNLITSGAGAGTPDVWADFFKHLQTDVDTWQSLGWQVYNQYWVPNNGNNC